MDSLVAFHTVKAHKDMHTMHASAMFYATKCAAMSRTGIEVYIYITDVYQYPVRLHNMVCFA